MLVYQREPHARQMAFADIGQPSNFAERLELADRTRREFDLDCDVVVDAMDDRSRALFGDQPNSLILVGPDGVVRLKQPWANPDALEAALPQLLPHLGKQLLTEAALVDSTLAQRVALVRASGDAAQRTPLREELRSAAESDERAAELRLLFELDVLRSGAEDALSRAALAALARDRFPGRPTAEAAYLAELLSGAASETQALLLDRLEKLAAPDGRTREWVRSKRQ